MNKIIHVLKPHCFFIAIFLIICVSILLRAYNLNDRIGLGSDSTRDTLIAQEALRRGELPLIGSFSSAGPFVFGPLYFWFNMVALTIIPFSFKTPWILMNIVGVFTVIVIMLCGYFVGRRKLAIIAGLLAAFSPQFVSRSTGLTQHSLVGITSALLLLFFILYWKKRSIKYAFFMGLSFGTALSMHYQALNFFIFIPFLFFLPKLSIKRKALAAILYCVGFLIPSLPLLYWDSLQSFANIRNVLDYMLIGQERIYVANSWRIFLFHFLIDYWSNVVGGNKVMSTIIMFSIPCIVFWAFIKRKIPGEIMNIGIIFFILLVVIRYYRGERFDGYMIYIAPFIFILCAWSFYILINLISKLKRKNIKKIAIFTAYVFFVLILVFDFKNATQFIFEKNSHQKNIREAEMAIITHYPGMQFQLYDYKWMSSEYSYAIGAFLDEKKLAKKGGVPIGIIPNTEVVGYTPTIYNQGGWKVVSLEYAPKQTLKRPLWSPVNPKDIYDDLITRWTKDQKLTSTFSLSKYILERLHLN